MLTSCYVETIGDNIQHDHGRPSSVIAREVGKRGGARDGKAACRDLRRIPGHGHGLLGPRRYVPGVQSTASFY